MGRPLAGLSPASRHSRDVSRHMNCPVLVPFTTAKSRPEEYKNYKRRSYLSQGAMTRANDCTCGGLSQIRASQTASCSGPPARGGHIPHQRQRVNHADQTAAKVDFSVGGDFEFGNARQPFLDGDAYFGAR